MSSVEETQLALQTTENILASLRREPEPDEATRNLIEAIEDERAALLAALVGASAIGRPPRRVPRQH